MTFKSSPTKELKTRKFTTYETGLFYERMINDLKSDITFLWEHECANLASLAFSCILKWILRCFDSLLNFSFPTIPLFNFHYPTFWILRKNHFVLLQWKLYRYYLSFLHGTIRSSQVVSLFRSGKSIVGCHTSVALWKMKDCWLVCKALYFEFLVFFYFAFGKDR